MRESVSAVFVSGDKVYFIKRQNYLSVFPGYYASPGGKVDKTDSELKNFSELFPKHINPQIIHALIREVREELDFDLEEKIISGEVISIDDIGVAITPEFNPYRFKNYYFKILLKTPFEFKFDSNEVEYGEWNSPKNLIERFNQGLVLAVPPAIVLLKTFAENLQHAKSIDLSLPYNPELEVPMIESICGVRQFLPLSNTFPPANRTNSFIIGDEGSAKILIDPSPKNELELEKFYRSIDKIGFNKIMLTHHHPDHYEFSSTIARKYKVDMLMSKDTHSRIGSEYFKDINIVIIKEGDCVTQSLGHDVLVYEVPGHDEGQLALAPKSLEWFLVGDLVQTIGTVAILAPEGDMKKYFKSLERVIALNPKNIIPSHGIIVGGTNKLVDTLNHRKSREAQIRNLKNENKNVDEILKAIYPDLEERLVKYAKKTIEAHLVKIESE